MLLAYYYGEIIQSCLGLFILFDQTAKYPSLGSFFFVFGKCGIYLIKFDQTAKYFYTFLDLANFTSSGSFFFFFSKMWKKVFLY